MLKHFANADFPLLESWITDANLLLQFSGTDFSYPLTKSQILNYQEKHLDRTFYLGYTSDNIPFAFGEIIPQESGIPRIARVLVGRPEMRGRSLGKYFIKLLLNESKQSFDCEEAELFVWNENHQAISCYKAVGFNYLPEKHRTLIHDEKSYHILRMTFKF